MLIGTLDGSLHAKVHLHHITHLSSGDRDPQASPMVSWLSWSQRLPLQTTQRCCAVYANGRVVTKWNGSPYKSVVVRDHSKLHSGMCAHFCAREVCSNENLSNL